MKPKQILFSVIIFLMLMTHCVSPKTYPQELDKLVPRTSLIFKGKIVLLNTVTTDEDRVSDAGVVTVTDVLEAPENFQNISGQQLTVRFADISQVKVGEERLFFTEPYWIGESIGVRENGSVLKGSTLYENKEISSLIKQARVTQDNKHLVKMISESKLVISGKVAKISEVKGVTTIGTEHDPEWKEAEIQIEEVIKGKTEGKTIKILFASGKDVMYFQSPKFKMDEEGIFFIQQSMPHIAKNFRNENMLTEPKEFIRGKERTAQIKSLIK